MLNSKYSSLQCQQYHQQQILCIILIIWNREKIFLGLLKILYLHNYWNLDAFYQKFIHMENFYHVVGTF